MQLEPKCGEDQAEGATTRSTRGYRLVGQVCVDRHPLRLVPKYPLSQLQWRRVPMPKRAWASCRQLARGIRAAVDAVQGYSSMGRWSCRSEARANWPQQLWVLSRGARQNTQLSPASWAREVGPVAARTAPPCDRQAAAARWRVAATWAHPVRRPERRPERRRLLGGVTHERPMRAHPPRPWRRATPTQAPHPRSVLPSPKLTLIARAACSWRRRMDDRGNSKTSRCFL